MKYDEEVACEVVVPAKKMEKLREVFHCMDVQSRTVADIITRLAETRAKEEKEVWDTVARLCGFKDNRDSTSQKKSFQLDWIRDVILVIKKKDVDSAQT